MPNGLNAVVSPLGEVGGTSGIEPVPGPFGTSDAEPVPGPFGAPDAEPVPGPSGTEVVGPPEGISSTPPSRIISSSISSHFGFGGALGGTSGSSLRNTSLSASSNGPRYVQEIPTSLVLVVL